MNTSSDFECPVIFHKAERKRIRDGRLTETRIMSKRGSINVHLIRIPEKSIRFVRDLWHTLVNMRWRWMMFNVALVNVSAYLIFSLLFLFDSWISGDFYPAQDHQTCIVGVHNFTSFFMLGIETITTTGYGYFHPTEYCKLGWIVLTCSTLVTIFIDGAFISVVYVKISKPANKLAKTFFSKKAVISLRNGKLCLIFRINDKTGKHWINTNVRIFITRDIITNEAESSACYMEEMNIEHFGENFWPVDIEHRIGKHSPLWHVSAKDLFTSRFEIMAVVTGSSILTGNMSTSQTSYTTNDIMWGYRFTRCIYYNRRKPGYLVNHKDFHRIVPHDAPLCSAFGLSQLQAELPKKRSSLTT